MQKTFITNLCNDYNGTRNDVLVMEGPLCYPVYKNDNFLCSQHQLMRAGHTCAPKKCSRENNGIRRRSRSRSRSRPRATSVEITSCQPTCNWATVLRTSTVENCRARVRKPASPSQNYPIILTASLVSVDKANSCPGTTICRCRQKYLTTPPTPPVTAVSNQRSIVEGFNSVGGNALMNQQFNSTDIVVTELKDEIEKVKCQLQHISHCRKSSYNFSDDPDKHNREMSKVINRLRGEITQLKKELQMKKKMHLQTIKEVIKAKTVLDDYEQKVGLLHEQAVKSSKVMKQSKDKFCRCLKEKEKLIDELKLNNDRLESSLKEKEGKYQDLNKTFMKLQDMFKEGNQQYELIATNNHKFCDFIQVLEKQLENSISESSQYQSELKKVEEQMATLETTLNQKLENKTKKQKEKYESRLKDHEATEKKLQEQISILSSKVTESEAVKSSYETLKGQMTELQHKIIEYEACASQCHVLEEKCREQYQEMLENDKKFERERNQMCCLVEELTNVVKLNKDTVLQLSKMNRQQEALLTSQSTILSTREQQIQNAESEIEMMRNRSMELQKEVNKLRKVLEGPCTKETCATLCRQIDEMKMALSLERDNQLVKEKIIEDQSQTICCLQNQIKEKMSELTRAKDDTSIAEEQLVQINNDLFRKHRELEKELEEKQYLMQKLQSLEEQKSQLSTEMMELENLLQNYCVSQQHDQQEHELMLRLQIQVEKQRLEWESQKKLLCTEKEKAVSAAKFATQKLLDTVADFQRQVDAQKKVQNLLTRMLHDKERQLRCVSSKITSINSIASGIEMPLDEIFRRNRDFDLSIPTTTSASFYSSCSACSKKILKNAENLDQMDLHELFKQITNTQEEPIKG